LARRVRRFADSELVGDPEPHAVRRNLELHPRSVRCDLGGVGKISLGRPALGAGGEVEIVARCPDVFPECAQREHVRIDVPVS
jgi:hypothetical protein